MGFSKNFKLSVAGMVAGALGVAGVATSNKDDVNADLTVDNAATATVDDNRSYDVEGAEFNLDADNPEIITEQAPDYEAFAKELQQVLNERVVQTMDIESIYDLPKEERAQFTYILAKDYRACAETLRQGGSLEDIQDMTCSRYFDENGKSSIDLEELEALSTLVQQEEYAVIFGGLPDDERQQQVYNELGEDFNTILKFKNHSAVERSKLERDILQNVSENISDIGELERLVSKPENELTDDERYTLEQAKSSFKSSVEESIDSYDMSDKSDLEYITDNRTLRYMGLLHGELDESTLASLKEVYNTGEVRHSEGVEYDSAMEFARQVARIANVYGVEDAVSVTYNINTKEVSITNKQDIELDLI